MIVLKTKTMSELTVGWESLAYSWYVTRGSWQMFLEKKWRRMQGKIPPTLLPVLWKWGQASSLVCAQTPACCGYERTGGRMRHSARHGMCAVPLILLKCSEVVFHFFLHFTSKESDKVTGSLKLIKFQSFMILYSVLYVHACACKKKPN